LYLISVRILVTPRYSTNRPTRGNHPTTPLAPALTRSRRQHPSCRSCWQLGIECVKRKRPSSGRVPRPLQCKEVCSFQKLSTGLSIGYPQGYPSCKDHLVVRDRIVGSVATEQRRILDRRMLTKDEVRWLWSRDVSTVASRIVCASASSA
jgi:hypothetical protein